MTFLTDAALNRLCEFDTVPERRAFLAGWSLATETNSSPPPPSPPPVTPSPTKKEFRIKRRGLRASILRHLYTGPASHNALSGAVEVAGTPLRHAITTLVRGGLVTCQVSNSGELFSLTPKGTEEAQWYVSHPSALMRSA